MSAEGAGYGLGDKRVSEETSVAQIVTNAITAAADAGVALARSEASSKRYDSIRGDIGSSNSD